MLTHDYKVLSADDEQKLAVLVKAELVHEWQCYPSYSVVVWTDSKGQPRFLHFQPMVRWKIVEKQE